MRLREFLLLSTFYISSDILVPIFAQKSLGPSSDASDSSPTPAFLKKASYAPKKSSKSSARAPRDFEFPATSFPSALENVTQTVTQNVRRSRTKRQSDSATEVVGLRLDAATSDSTARTLKRGARSVARGRKRRSISLDFITQKLRRLFGKKKSRGPRYGPPSHHPPAPIAALGAILSFQQGQGQQFGGGGGFRGPVIQTRIQGIWNSINFNYPLARRFLLSNPVQSDQSALRIVVTNPNGVTCDDVCDPNGPGFGTIGICTEKYCKCDFTGWSFERFDCPIECVFDPGRLICDYPQNVVLCNDDDENDGDGDFNNFDGFSSQINNNFDGFNSQDNDNNVGNSDQFSGPGGYAKK